MAAPPEFRPRRILEALVAHGIDFVLIGGLAGVAHGSSYPSYDVDMKRAAGEPAQIEGAAIYVASLDHLIAMKEHSGRARDKLMASEYRVLADELRRQTEEL